MRLLPTLATALVLSSSTFSSASPEPHGAVPSPRQLAWQRMELYAFVHFGLNTYTNREWGYGDEDPKLFNPSSFDARAIVRHFKEAGMKGVIVTAKHHDGFCLWPTETTGHNISKSPWKGGKGDVIRDFADACKAEDFKLGIYVSPWDRNHAEYAREGYVETFHKQVLEVLTNYGPVFEIWFDGANGGDGSYGGARERRTIPDNYYRFSDLVEKIRKVQPECVVWGGGGDARWGGSEQGHVAYPHWHTMDSKRGGNGATGVPHGDTWMPAEGDTSIRPGWFWHAHEDSKVKSGGKLLDVWFDSVGRGANLILNVPPNRDGRIAEPDVRSLMEFKRLRDELLATDFARGAKTVGPAPDPKHSARALVDGDIETFWCPGSSDEAPAAAIGLPVSATFDVVRIREQIRLGQRVDAFALDVWEDGGWNEIHQGKTIGNQVLVRLPQAVTTDRVRLRVTKSVAPPCISEISLLKMPELPVDPKIAAMFEGEMPKTGWKIVAKTFGNAEVCIDGDPNTLWNTHPLSGELPPPQGFTIDLGREIRIEALTYLPRQDGVAHGMTDRYRFELSGDGETWRTAAEGEFANVRANPIRQVVPLAEPSAARFVRFTGLHAVEKNHITAAEVGVIPAR
ncbi:MAG: alpha-L-fucosidase [Akkermansiaceae bacterium]|nr:alpha-L-fucosidase [Akkermansiaceae bacterium]